VSVLSRVHPEDVVDAYDLVEIAAACRRLKAWADGVEVEAAAALARHPVCHAPEAARNGFSSMRAAGQLLAARLGVAPSTAADRVATACQLVAELPDTVAALFRGEIDYPKASALAIGVRQLDPPDGCQDAVTGEVVTADGLRRGLVAQVESAVLAKAGRRSQRQHRDAVARAVAALAPTTAEERHERACEQRQVEFRPDADGMAWLNVYGPAEDLTAVTVMLDAAADAATTEHADDARTADQLRVDSLAALAWASLAAGHLGGCGHGCGPKLGKRHGRAATVNVTVPYSTLIGIDDSPGELEGYGPITAAVARRIAADGTWRRLLTDPASAALLDYGQTRYTPPQDLVDHVIARDKTCRFPTCSQPARRCQIDHTIAAGADGWSTSAHNCGPLSGGGCHNTKTHAGWQLQQPEPGRYMWTAPTGHTYTIDPEVIGPILQRAGPRPALSPGDPPEPDRAPDGDTGLDRNTGLDPPPF
jgi:putative component of membrane protein insertase Oxa1/YidC/SpoIIIJ protein YidD